MKLFKPYSEMSAQEYEDFDIARHKRVMMFEFVLDMVKYPALFFIIIFIVSQTLAKTFYEYAPLFCEIMK